MRDCTRRRRALILGLCEEWPWRWLARRRTHDRAEAERAWHSALRRSAWPAELAERVANALE